MSINTKEVEKEILDNIENLIVIISKIGQPATENINKHVLEAEYLIMKTNLLLEQFLQRKDLPLEQIYRQLISQKLPHSPLQNSIENLEQALETVFALPVFQNKSTKEEPPTIIKETTLSHPRPVTNCFSEKSKITINKLIVAFYPREKILKNHMIRSHKLDYFLPQKKLAILLTPVYYRRSFSLNMLILRESIRLVEITPRDLDNPPLLYQKLSPQIS